MSVYQEYITDHYSELNDRNEEKEKIAQDLDYSFNKVFFETRGYIAYEETPYRDRAISEFDDLEKSIKKLEGLKIGIQDDEFYTYVSEFHDKYIYSILPQIYQDVEDGKRDKVKVVAIGGLSDQILEMQATLRNYRLQMDKNVEENFKELSKKIHQSQTYFLFFLFIMLLTLALLSRMMITKIGGPLSDFAETADLISQGKEVTFDFNSHRQDELGLLSRAFGKMILSIQDNEQQLVAQNEELQAQQDELQTQHIELEQALEVLRKNEFELLNRNELINNLSSSLIKKDVLNSIVENMSHILDADNGFIGFLNIQDYAVFGISHERGKRLLHTLFEGSARRVIDTKKPYSIRRETETIEKDFREITLYCTDLYVPILNTVNEVQAVMIFTKLGSDFREKDIQESESLAKQIALSLERIKLFEESEHDRLLTQNILDTIHEGIQLVGVTGQLLQVNTKLCDLLSCQDHKDLVGKEQEVWLGNLLEIVDDPPSLATFYKSVLDGSYNGNSFIYHIGKPEQKVIQVYCEPLKRGSEKFGTLFVHRDITREYEVDQMKSEFVSTVSHELRTPLASVLGFTELLIHRDLKPERKLKYLQTIYQEAKRLTGLINDFLDVQRMEAGKQSYEKEFLDLVPIMKNVIDTQQLYAASHPISIEVNTGKTTVFGDRAKLTQVFTNLLSNAIKYSPNGGNVEILLEERNGYLQASIKDRGLGIPEESIPHLFSKFYRVDNSDRRKIGGTGLGLAIVKEIMKAHDGDVTVSSKLRKGSTFTLHFPIPLLLEDTNEGNSLINEKQMLRLNDIHVVIIEDDPSLASLLKGELKESGFLVNHVSTAEAAIDLFKQKVPDSVVVDIMLNDSGMNGWELIDYMKTEESLRNIPIFISSALEEKERGQKIGAKDYLVKPYQPSKLTKAILQTLINQDRRGQIMIPEEK